MKRTLITVLCVILALSLLSMACSKKKSTTSPSAPTNTPGVVNSPTVTPTAVQELAVLDFSTSSQATGWTVSDYICCEDGFTAVNYDSTAGDGHNGSTGCLSVTANFVPGTLTYTAEGAIQYSWGTANPVNLTNQTLICWVNIPAALATGLFGLQISINTGAGYTYADGGWHSITTSGWQSFTWDLATNPPTVTGIDTTSVDKINFQITDSTATDTTTGVQTVYFDDISY